MTAEDQVATARRLRASRRARDALFGAYAAGFGEPAWDMLLELFIRSAEDGSVTRDQLGLIGGDPDTSSRYCEWLIANQLATRDKRSDELRLSDHGRDRMTAFLSAQILLEAQHA